MYFKIAQMKQSQNRKSLPSLQASPVTWSRTELFEGPKKLEWMQFVNLTGRMTLIYACEGHKLLLGSHSVTQHSSCRQQHVYLPQSSARARSTLVFHVKICPLTF